MIDRVATVKNEDYKRSYLMKRELQSTQDIVGTQVIGCVVSFELRLLLLFAKINDRLATYVEERLLKEWTVEAD